MNITCIFSAFFFLISPVFGLTINEWQKLDQDQKYEVIESGELDSKEYKFNEISNDRLKKSLLRMKADVVSNVGTEPIENDVWNSEVIFTVGDIQIGTIEQFTIDETTVAVSFTLYQAGGASFDHGVVETKHYNTQAEAVSAGMDVSADVSWQVISSFELTTSGYSEILIDHWGEGGFRWTGW